MPKKIDWNHKIQMVKPDIGFAEKISVARKLNLDCVKKVLGVNVIPASTLSILCGYGDHSHIMHKISRGDLMVCYPFAITVKKNVIKGHMFVKLDLDCMELIKRRMG